MVWGVVSETRASELRRGRTLGCAVIAAVVFLFVVAPAAQAGLGDYRCSDTGRVYYGNARLIRKPAVVSADRVYRHISEYQQILKEGLTDNDVRYHFLMKQASKRFLKAVKSMARALGYDFVAEVGAVQVVRQGAGVPVDRTDDVIERLG